MEAFLIQMQATFSTAPKFPTIACPDLDASSSASNFQSLYFGCSRRMSTVHHSWHIPLVVQDSNPPTTIVAAVRNTKSKRNRPLYSHCGIQGHTIDKRYKLHDYPPGYKFKPKAGTSNPQINQTISRLHERTLAPIETLQAGPSISDIHGPYSGHDDWKSTKQGNLDVLDSASFSYFPFNILAN
ncbi:hypothetical protein CK203_056846 [Vitis vinifera]|uniref:Uncharacterized protein n=1 Tax=Vitis vinifera TaxID=29760 RepID=A0A438GQC3_VITVI|nr:hypothetical protein CK203_056846 [Vitis vinifera]